MHFPCFSWGRHIHKRLPRVNYSQFRKEENRNFICYTILKLSLYYYIISVSWHSIQFDTNTIDINYWTLKKNKEVILVRFWNIDAHESNKIWLDWDYFICGLCIPLYPLSAWICTGFLRKVVHFFIFFYRKERQKLF